MSKKLMSLGLNVIKGNTCLKGNDESWKIVF